MKKPIVVAVHKSSKHNFSKDTCLFVNLLAGLGIEGDAHMGEKVQHGYDVRKNPDKPNLRQVHLMHNELFDELKNDNYTVLPGQLGENITTANIDLLNLPKDTIMKFPSGASIQITGLRNPCTLIDKFQSGLMKALIDKDEDGNIIRKTGIMSIVLTNGLVHAGDEIEMVMPTAPFVKMGLV